MMKFTLLAASALTIAAFASQTVSAATVTCEMPISRGSGGLSTDPVSGHRRFDLCGADGFAGTANVLRLEQYVSPNPDGSQLWLTVQKTSGAGSAHLYIVNGSLGTLVTSTSGTCEKHDALGGGSTGTTTDPCITNVNVANIHMNLQIDH